MVDTAGAVVGLVLKNYSPTYDSLTCMSLTLNSRHILPNEGA